MVIRQDCEVRHQVNAQPFRGNKVNRWGYTLATLSISVKRKLSGEKHVVPRCRKGTRVPSRAAGLLAVQARM